MQIGSFYRSVRHVPPAQLLRRVGLTLRRKVTMSPLGKPLRRRRRSPLPLADELPRRIFPPRQRLVRTTNEGVFLCQLNREYRLDDKIDWQLGGYADSTHLERLAFHYLEHLEAIDPRLARSIVLGWIVDNPPWQPGYWLDAWNSYAVSIRCVCIMQWIADHPTVLTADEYQAVNGAVAEQLRYLAGNLETDIRGNHLIKNIKCLLWAGRFFDDRESNDWLATGRRLLDRELKQQFLGDGTHFELSPAYHCQVFADLLECAAVSDASDRRRIISRLTAAAHFIANMTHPDQRISLFSDGGLHMAYSPKECLDAYRKLGGESAEAEPVFRFSDSGYYGLRSEGSLFVFDCGPSCADQLPAHGHGDILAFEWSVGGERLIVDPGVSEYEIGPTRERDRSTPAHNTVTVGDRNQCEFLRNFRVGRRAHGRCIEHAVADDELRVTGAYTARQPDGFWTHRRQVRVKPDTIMVEDQIETNLAEPVVARLLLHHDCRVSRPMQETQQALSRGIEKTPRKHTIEIQLGATRVTLASSSELRVCESAWSPDFGVRHPTQQIEIHYGSGSCHGEFSLGLSDPGEVSE